MAQAIPEQVEDRVRLAALAKRVRTTEFFKDFDKLRTGYITSECVVCDWDQVHYPDQRFVFFSNIIKGTHAHCLICTINEHGGALCTI